VFVIRADFGSVVRASSEDAQTVCRPEWRVMAVVALIPQSSLPICWAACLGECSLQHSREHIVTESTLQGSQLNVRGFLFLHGNTISLHKSHFKSNILCEAHNNALSQVDEAGTVAFNALRDSAGPNPRRTNKVNGTLLERWLLKTLINMEVLADFNLWPPRDIAEIAFGRNVFAPNAGLFLLGYSFDPEFGDERVSYTRFIEEGAGNKIVGGRFKFRSFDLLLTLAANPFPELQIVVNGGEATNVKPLHHPRRFVFGNSNFVAVSWKK